VSFKSDIPTLQGDAINLNCNINETHKITDIVEHNFDSR